MKKFYFLIGVVLIGIMGMNLKEKYDTFVFHAYTTTFTRGIYEGSSENFLVTDCCVLQDGQTYEIGYAKISNINQIEISDIDILIDNYKYPLEYTIDETGTIYLDSIHPISFGELKLQINDEIIPLSKSNYTTYEAKVEDYHISDFYVTEDMIVLGYINCNNEGIIEQYPNITLEYDYIIEDRTIAYYAMKDETVNWINSNHTQVLHNVEVEDGQFIIIVSLEGEQTDVYSFTLEKVGE